MGKKQENAESGTFVCNVCEKKFKYKRVLERHLITHKDNSKFWCRSCIKPFASLEKKEEHRLLKHSKIKKKSCRICPNTDFKTEEEYLWHIKDTHEGKLADYYMCSDCGKQFKTKSELTHHINSNCGTIKQYKCQVCGQELMTSGSLHNHMLRHNGERSYMCRFCAKLFLTAGQLKVHERIHTQEKAFVCNVCGKGFCHRQSLITHSTIHTGIKPFQCENCGNAFSCIGNLLKHRRTHAETCGLLPLTTHRVKDPSTKLKLKINTPTNSRLRAQRKEKELQEKLAALKPIKDYESVPDPSLNVDHNSDNEKSKEDCSNTELNKALDIKNEINSDCKFDVEKFDYDLLHTEEKPDIDSDSDNEDVKNDNFCTEELVQKQSGLKSHQEETIFNPDEKTEVTIKDESTVNVKTENDSNEKTEEDIKPNVTHTEENRKFSKNSAIKVVDARRLQNKQEMLCKYCSKGYSTVKWLLRHEMKHNEFRSDEKKENSVSVKHQLHSCNFCATTFNLKEELKEHRLKIHADLLTCQNCDKIFANVDSLKSHQNIFHKGLPRKVYTYICEKCGKQFKYKSNMTYHEQNNCATGPFFPCNVCLKKFSSVHTRRSHMRVHDPEKKLLCKFCGKSFHWKGQLKIHERSHTGEKPFSCLYCPKAFAYRESLLTHSSLHTGIKPHLCEACGSRFSCIGNLIKHRVTHAMTCGVRYSKNANN